MPRLIIILLILGAVFFFISKVVFEFLGGISSTKSAIRKAYGQLEALISDIELSPWDHDEIDHISRQSKSSSTRDLFTTTTQGVYYSIFGEPLIAFASREFASGQKRVIVIRYNDSIFRLLVQEGEVIVNKGSELLAKFQASDGLELIQESHKIHLDTLSTAGLWPVSVDGKYSMSIIAPDDRESGPERILKKVHEHNEEEGELLLLALSYALVDQHI